MFYVCEGNLVSPLPVPEVAVRETLHPKHVQFVADGVEKGVVVFGGPKPGSGGIVLLKAPSLDACRAFLRDDPLVKAGVQTYRITEFRIMEHNPCLDPLLTEENGQP